MTPEDKIKFLLDAIESESLENVEPNTPLDDIEEWDSIGALMLISEVDDSFGTTINPEDLEKISTVEELINLF
jgi:acyl carrier protein